MMLDSIPKYKMMADRIREDICSGKFKAGEKLKPDTEIAKEYGINKRTVANAMAQLVADGLISRMPGRGSVVVRQEVVARKSDAVGVVNYSSGDLYSNMEAEITAQTLKKGFYPLWVPPSLFDVALRTPNYRPFIQMLEHFINDCPYGMLVHGDRFIPFDLLERNLAKIGKLVFLCNYLHDKKIKAKYVLIDYVHAAKLIVKHFAVNGHRKITFLPSAMSQPVTSGSRPPQQILLDEVSAVASEYGVEVDTEIPALLMRGVPIEQVIREHLSGSGITGAFLGYDSLYPVFYKNALDQYGFSFGDQLSLIGFFNTHYAAEWDLTSIDIHEREIAHIATEMLFDESDEIKEIFVKPELIVRNSVKKI